MDATPDLKVAQFRALFERVGIDPSTLRTGVLERMQLLAELTEVVSDCERAVQLACKMFRHYAQHQPASAFSELEQRIVMIGSLFSDIGKTGPANADRDQQRVVTEVFSIENVPDPAMTLAKFLAHYFPQDAQRRLHSLAALGIDPGSSMRSFWNQHSAWTLQIIDQDGVPAEAVAAAASHHLLENVNPEAIVAADGRFTRYFGANERFDRPEKLVIVLDKYDASRRRTGRTHAETIAWLRDLVAAHPRFGSDAELATLIHDLDVVLATSPAD